MVRLAGVLLVLASCQKVFDLYPSVESDEPTEADNPWREVTVEESARGTFVIATRAQAFDLPDLGVEYRLYRVGQPWQLVDSGSMDAKNLDPRFVPEDATYRGGGSCVIDEDFHVRCQ